jgi:hypothetical protein
MDDIRLNCDATFSVGPYTLSIALINSKYTRHQQCIVTLAPRTNYFDKIDKAKHIIQWTNITKINFVKVSEAPETFGLQLFLTLESNGKETQVVNIKIPATSSNFLYIDKNQPTGRRLQIQAQEIRDSIDFDEWKQLGWICTETADSIVCEATNKHAQKPSEEGNNQPENTDKKHAETTKGTWTLETLLKLPQMWTFYDVLDVQRNFTNRELERNYRKKCLKWHPDRGPKSSKAEDGAGVSEYGEFIFKLLGEAYNTLKDRDLKYEHDEEISANQTQYLKIINGKRIYYRKPYSWMLEWDLSKKDAGEVVKTFYNRYFIEL